MEKRDRDQIDRFCDRILPEINIFSLWPRLIEFGVFNEDDVNVPIWEESLDHPETVCDIIKSIKTRGPCAFQNFLRSLRQTNHNNLADILDGSRDSSSNNNISNNINNSPNDGTDDESLMEDKYHENLQVTKEPLNIKVRKSKRFFDGPEYDTILRYPMMSKPRGYVLIITIISYINENKRDAAEFDEANLIKLFQDMGFEVTARNNLTGAEIKREVKEFSERKSFYKVDSSFVIISAHGAETQNNGLPETEIQGVDYESSGAEKVYCNDIIDFFVAEKCKQLRGKPKVFIFQACRGKREQGHVTRSAADGHAPETAPPIRNYSDILVAHSTMPGYFAYRDKINGSWYIQILCEVFMNYACEMHLQDLFNMVDRRLMNLRTEQNKSQTSTTKSIGFNKHCFLYPGLFPDS